MVLGIPQLLETVGRATAAAMSASSVPFVAIPGDLHHALDYIPDESDLLADVRGRTVSLSRRRTDRVRGDAR